MRRYPQNEYDYTVLVNILLLSILFLAVVLIAYLMFRVTKDEHKTREYAWTWLNTELYQKSRSW